MKLSGHCQYRSCSYLLPLAADRSAMGEPLSFRSAIGEPLSFHSAIAEPLLSLLVSARPLRPVTLRRRMLHTQKATDNNLHDPTVITYKSRL